MGCPLKNSKVRVKLVLEYEMASLEAAMLQTITVRHPLKKMGAGALFSRL